MILSGLSGQVKGQGKKISTTFVCRLLDCYPHIGGERKLNCRHDDQGNRSNRSWWSAKEEGVDDDGWWRWGESSENGVCVCGMMSINALGVQGPSLLLFFFFFFLQSVWFYSLFFFFSFCSFLITGKTRGYRGILRPSVLASWQYGYFPVVPHMPNMQATNRDAMLRGGPRMRYRAYIISGRRRTIRRDMKQRDLTGHWTNED